jgi:hypothetical protein
MFSKWHVFVTASLKPSVEKINALQVQKSCPRTFRVEHSPNGSSDDGRFALDDELEAVARHEDHPLRCRLLRHDAC